MLGKVTILGALATVAVSGKPPREVAVKDWEIRAASPDLGTVLSQFSSNLSTYYNLIQVCLHLSTDDMRSADVHHAAIS
jgi:hypothetical protein